MSVARYRERLIAQANGIRRRLAQDVVVIKEGHSINHLNPLGEHVAISLSPTQRFRRVELLKHIEELLEYKKGSERIG